MHVVKEFIFDAAHKLENYDGPCARLHGHTYKLAVAVQGSIRSDGMIEDFSVINNVVQACIIDVLDHSYLNDLVRQPTAEHLIQWIWNQLKKQLSLFEITLWETPTSYVVYRGGNDV